MSSTPTFAGPVAVPGARATAWAAALLGVLIAASYPAVSRVAVKGSLTPQDLLVLRFGISGLLLLPLLVMRASHVPRGLWRASVLLAFLQGWGPAACVLFGLQYTTAAHASALFQGALPLWVAALGFLLYGMRPTGRQFAGIAVIAVGTLVLVAGPPVLSARSHHWVGDALLMCAPLLASGYLLYVQRTRVNPLLGVALVATVSALVVLPWALWNGQGRLAHAPVTEILWQVLFQGVLIGCVGMLCLHHAVLSLGSQIVGALLALVPVLGLLFSVVVAHDAITPLEGASAAVISAGVWLATRTRREALKPR